MFIEYSLPDLQLSGTQSPFCGYAEGVLGQANRASFQRWKRPGAWFRAGALIALLAGHLWASADDEFQSLVRQAFDLHRRGQFAAAMPLLRRAYPLQPRDYFVNLLLGIDTLRTGDAPGAIPYLKKASQVRPREEFPLDYLGEAYARQELYADAAAAYLKAVDVSPTSADSSIALVDFALSRFADISALLRSSSKGLAAEYRLRALALGPDDPTRASLLQRSADLDPAAPGVRSDLGRAELASGDATAAAHECQQAIELDPNDLSAWLLEAHLAAKAGDWKRVNLRLNLVAQRSPQTLSQETARWPKQNLPPAGSDAAAAATFFRCVQQGQTSCNLDGRHVSPMKPDALFREQRWSQLTSLPAPPPEARKSWLQRGIAFASLEECSKAIPALERGLAGSFSEFYGFFKLSWCYSQEAGRTSEKVQQSADNEASVHILRGDILLRLQAKAERAVSEYQQALAHDGNDPAILERLAEAQFGSGATEEARANAQAALKIDPQRLSAKRTLAKIAIQERDYATALPYLRELAARNPRDVTGRVELGKACAQTGALDEAWQNLAPALERGYPDEKGSLHYLLGSVLKRMGRTVDAEQAFAAATQLSDAFQHKSYRDQDADAQP